MTNFGDLQLLQLRESESCRRPDPLGEAPARGGATDAALEPRLAELAQDPGAQVPFVCFWWNNVEHDTILTFENPHCINPLSNYHNFNGISCHIRDHTSEASHDMEPSWMDHDRHDMTVMTWSFHHFHSENGTAGPQETLAKMRKYAEAEKTKAAIGAAANVPVAPCFFSSTNAFHKGLKGFDMS